MVTTQNFRLLEVPENDQLEALRRAGLTFSFREVADEDVFTLNVSREWYVGEFNHFRALVNRQGNLKVVLMQVAGAWSLLHVVENCPVVFVPSSTYSGGKTTALFQARSKSDRILGRPVVGWEHDEAIARSLGDVFARLSVQTWA